MKIPCYINKVISQLGNLCRVQTKYISLEENLFQTNCILLKTRTLCHILVMVEGLSKYIHNQSSIIFGEKVLLSFILIKIRLFFFKMSNESSNNSQNKYDKRYMSLNYVCQPINFGKVFKVCTRLNLGKMFGCIINSKEINTNLMRYKEFIKQSREIS